MKTKKSLFTTAEGQNYLLPFILVTTLFFLWGFAHSILDVLNKHFQETLHINKTESALVQAMVYGGYFLMAIPAGMIIKRFGYRAGVLTGLLLYGCGALLFIPGGNLNSFPFFLFSLFIIGCGLTCLETAANPYVTVLGDASGAESRINLSQSFNGLGWMLGPLVGGWFLFASSDGGGNIAKPYAVIGVIVLIVAFIFTRVKLPEVGEDNSQAVTDIVSTDKPLIRQTSFLLGMVALFLYVAAQTGVNSFFINYVTENAHISNYTASILLSIGGMGLFFVGRMAGSMLMTRFKAELILLLLAVGAALAMCVLLTGAGKAGIAAFFVCYFCESIMFPTIFALALRGVGTHTKMASSLLIMCIVGGAIAPVLMGAIADHSTMAMGFVVPLVCYIGVALYALYVNNRRKSLVA